jgi:hypothetical protein
MACGLLAMVQAVPSATAVCVQEDDEQASVVHGFASSHGTPQFPQLFSSDDVSLQTPPHTFSDGAPHDAPHFAFVHVAVPPTGAWQSITQLPQ